MSRRWAGQAALVAAALLAGCARPSVRAPVPETVDLVYPAPTLGSLRGGEADRLQRAWEKVLAGDAQNALRDFQKLRATRPGFPPFETGEAYARLRVGDLDGALRGFDAALARDPGYLPALLGAGAAARGRGLADQSLAHYRRALEIAPDDPVARRRSTEVKLQVTERHVAAALAARQRNDAPAAIAEYRAVIEAAPELSDVRIELANLLLQSGDSDGALALLEADPRQERHVQLALADLLVARKQPARALEVYRGMLARDPQDAEARRRAFEASQAMDLSKLPIEYRAISKAARVSRADLAALLITRVRPLQRLQPGEGRVATDISGSWARDQILRVLALDVMDLYPNHTFQPAASVRRGDLALALGRVLELVGSPQRPPPALKDVTPNNLLYPAVSRVVAAGLMDVTPDGAFEPWRPVSGADAVAVVDALARLVGP